MSKKLLALIFAALLLFSLASCGNPDETSSEESSSESVSESMSESVSECESASEEDEEIVSPDHEFGGVLS